MATRTGTTIFVEENVVQASWSGLLNGDDGSVTQMAKWSVKSVQATGTFGAAGSVAVEGSNDPGPTPTNWAPLRDNVGVLIALTAATAIREIGENTRHIRPRVTAGDGTTNLVVTIIGV